MGPIAAQIYQIRNWYRMRFLVSGDARANLQPIVASICAYVKEQYAALGYGQLESHS